MTPLTYNVHGKLVRGCLLGCSRVVALPTPIAINMISQALMICNFWSVLQAIST